MESASLAGLGLGGDAGASTGGEEFATLNSALPWQIGMTSVLHPYAGA